MVGRMKKQKRHLLCTKQLNNNDKQATYLFLINISD